MVDGTYNIKVDVPFGRKDGTVVLRTDGDVVFADVDAPIIGKLSIEGRAEGDNKFTAEGTGKFKLVGVVDYTVEGEVAGDELHIDVTSEKGGLKLEGVRV